MSELEFRSVATYYMLWDSRKTNLASGLHFGKARTPQTQDGDIQIRSPKRLFRLELYCEST